MSEIRFGRLRWYRAVGILAATACLLFATPKVFAGGGNVIPPTAKVKGYSLAEAAASTAYFNEGPHTPDTVPSGFPFQILYVPADGDLTFNVRTGTMFYVPLVYSDSTDSAFWPFPDVTNAEAVSDYYFDTAQLGAEVMDVIVDGEITSLARKYAAGAVTPGLPSGGSSYTVVAAFLAPLTKGSHTVTLRVLLNGAFLGGGEFEFETTYTVNVN